MMRFVSDIGYYIGENKDKLHHLYDDENYEIFQDVVVHIGVDVMLKTGVTWDLLFPKKSWVWIWADKGYFKAHVLGEVHPKKCHGCTIKLPGVNKKIFYKNYFNIKTGVDQYLGWLRGVTMYTKKYIDKIKKYRDFEEKLNKLEAGVKEKEKYLEYYAVDFKDSILKP